jgi:hypothetical protein
MWTRSLTGLWHAVVDPHEFFSSPPPAFHCVVPVLLSVLVDWVLVYLRGPFVLKAALSSLPEGLAVPAGALDMPFARFTLWSYAGVPARIALFVGAVSVLVFLTLGAQGHLARFSRLLLVVSYASLILVVKRCLGVGILYLRGLDRVEQPTDIEPILGLGILAPDASPLLRQTLESVNVFDVWFLVVVVAALSASERIPLRDATVAAVSAWLIVQAFGLGLNWLLFQNL